MFYVMFLKARKKDDVFPYLEGSNNVIISGVFNSFLTLSEFRLGSLRLKARRDLCLVGMVYYIGRSIFVLDLDGIGKLVLILWEIQKRVENSCLWLLLFCLLRWWRWCVLDWG